MRREADRLLLFLLALAFAEAVVLVARTRPDVRAWLPLQAAEDPPGALQGPDAATQALRARVAAVGPAVTIEDLARGTLALERGELPGVAPLSDRERAEVLALVQAADKHRDELLAVEADLAAAEAELTAKARVIAAGLTPTQRAWVMTRRDQVSVGQVEKAYWDELLVELEPGR